MDKKNMMSQEKFFQEMVEQQVSITDEQFEYDQYICKVALESHNLNCTPDHKKCTACDGIGYFYLSNHRLIQCEKCHGKG
jgi:hypothetical protein